VGGGLLALSLYVVTKALGMGVGTPDWPGPGFFPLGAGALLGIVSLGVLARALTAARRAGHTVEIGHPNIVLAVAVLLVFVVLLEPLGFVIVASGMLFVLLWRLSPLSLPWAAGVAVGASLLSFHLFHRVLGLYLPGLLGGFR
jgi:putative tricarboxylic transport membrane protein